MIVALLATLLLAGCYDVQSLLHLHDGGGAADLGGDLGGGRGGDLGGDLGVITSDGGPEVTWSVRATPSFVLRAVWGSGPNDLWAVGDGGAILHSTDGTTWNQVASSATPYNLYAVWGASSLVYAVGDNSEIVTLSSGGATYSTQRFPTSGTTEHGVWGDGAGNLWVANLIGIGYSADGGVTWNGQTSAGGFHALFGESATSLWAVGHGSAAEIEHYNGSTWLGQDATAGAGATLNGVWGSGADLFAVGTEGMILATTNSGATWSGRLGPSTDNYNAVWGTSPANVYVVGDNGVIKHSVDQGLTWQSESGGTSALFGIWGSGADDVYAVGDHVILHRP